eukprot:SAG31_NODE_30154_length_384_cov_4.663158_1_plen_33_part_10
MRLAAAVTRGVGQLSDIWKNRMTVDVTCGTDLY